LVTIKVFHIRDIFVVTGGEGWRGSKKYKEYKKECSVLYRTLAGGWENASTGGHASTKQAVREAYPVDHEETEAEAEETRQAAQGEVGARKA
jgi:hypothetical protein